MKKIVIARHFLFSTLLLAFLGGCDWFSCSHSTCASHKHAAAPTAKAPETKAADTTPAEETSTDVMVKVTSMDAFTKNVLQASKPVVVKLSAKWCSACQTVAPTVEKVAHQLKDQYTFVTVDLDQVEQLSSTYNVQGIPAFLFFKDGKELSDKRAVGAMDEQEFKNKIAAAFGK